MSLYERLLFLEAEMRLVAEQKPLTSSDDLPHRSGSGHESEISRFRAMAVYDPDGNKTPLFGTTNNFPEFSKIKISTQENKKAAIITTRGFNLQTSAFMVLSNPRGIKTPHYILGEINKTYLQQVMSENILPPMAEFLVLDSSQNILISSITPDSDLTEIIKNLTGDSVSGQFLWKLKDRDYRAGHNSLFLKPRYSIPGWTIILLQPDNYTLQSVNEFKKIFPLVILLSLLIVIFLSLFFVRKSIIPLEKLKNGTQRIVEGNFKDSVNIESADEFEELANSFNFMVEKLDLQFNELRLSAAIGHFSAEDLKIDELIGEIINSINHYLSFDRAALLLVNEDSSRVHYKAGYGYSNNEKESFTFFFNDRRAFNPDNLTEKAMVSKQPVFCFSDDESDIKNCLEAKTFSSKAPNMLSIYVPIVYEDSSTGALIFENKSKKIIPVTIDGNFLRGLGSQIAVSLSNNTSYQKLQESEERFRKAFDHAASGITFVATNMQFLTVNSYLLKMLGYEENEFLNKTLETISNSGHFMAELSSHQRLLKRDIDFDVYEKKFIHKDGHEIWGLVSICLLFDKNENPLYYIMHVQNLSDLKEAEKIQTDLKNQLRLSRLD